MDQLEREICERHNELRSRKVSIQGVMLGGSILIILSGHEEWLENYIPGCYGKVFILLFFWLS